MKIVKLDGTQFVALDARGDDLSSPFGCARCAVRGAVVIIHRAEELKAHMEKLHHTPVLIDEEIEDAIERFRSLWGECEHCKAANAPWTRDGVRT